MPTIIGIDALSRAEEREILHQLLLNDGIIAYPTDTLYGLGGNFHSLNVHQRLDAIKGRSDRPYSIAVRDLTEMSRLAAPLPDWVSRFGGLLFPGPFTLVLQASRTVSRSLLRGGSGIGIRIPGPPFPREILTGGGMALISTSVNHSGHPPLNDPLRIQVEFPEIDGIIDGGSLPDSPGSTVLDARCNPPVVLRRGAGWERLVSLGIL